jgi:hypothetical protein
MLLSDIFEPFPASGLDTLPNLIHVDVHGNALSGNLQLPKSEGLALIDVSDNHLSGQVGQT